MGLGIGDVMDQNATPILDAIEQYRSEGNYTFALPGHRFGAGIDERTLAVLSPGVFQADVITAKQAVPESEKLLADAVGAREAVFTTCGSSISIHTAMLTITGPGKRILVDRNVHKSVVASLILAGARPVWLRPRWDHERQVAHPATAGDVETALERDPDVSAVLMITPTEYGTGADVRGVAEICHRRGIPLMVDEAWGAHFPFHPSMPTAAIRAGADLVVQSLHKADGGLCQASLILIGGDLVDPVDLRLRLDLITTTSPSALLFGSIDGFRHRMVKEGRQLLDDALRRAETLRGRLTKVAGLSVMDESILGQDGVAEWDPLKLSVDVSALGITGYQAKDWLQQERHLTVQLGDARRIVCSLTYADDDAAIERLAQALEVTDPAGRISAEMISPYPPGVPAILPGECFNAEVVDYLRAGLAAGMTLPDAADPTLKTFRVVNA
jgi:arginine decarboxylase